MKKMLLLAGCLACFTGFAQKTANPQAYAKIITPSDLKKNLAIVASREMEGRETATEGQRRAAAFIESQFKALGLQPGNNGSYQLSYPVYQDSLIDASIEVNGTSFQYGKDLVALPTNAASTLRFSEVVWIGAGAADSIRNANLGGRLVMIAGNIPMGRMQNSGLFGLLLSKGVAGILAVPGGALRNGMRKSNQYNNLFKRSVPPQLFTISDQVARAILGDGYDAAHADRNAVKAIPASIVLDTKKATVTTQSSNVIAYLPGTDLKDQYLFVTAHYDHLGKRGDSVIYYGADDDGSGTVSVLQIAKAFAQAKAAGKGPRRTMVFMTVSGEEKGLWGSDYYSSHPVFPLDKTTADLNIDMIGRSDSSRHVGDSTNYVYVVGDDKLSSDLRPISEGVNKKYAKLELDYKFNDPSDVNRIYYRSDHFNFAKRGVPIIFYYDGMLGADYHKPTDTPDKINYNLLAKRAQLVFYTAWEMANRNDMLKRDIPLAEAYR